MIALDLIERMECIAHDLQESAYAARSEMISRKHLAGAVVRACLRLEMTLAELREVLPNE